MNNKPFLPEECFSSTEIQKLTLVKPPHRIGLEPCSASIGQHLTNDNNNSAFSNKVLSGSIEKAVEAQSNVAWWPNMLVLEELATDPNTPVVLLEQLAWHPSSDIRALVAENQNTSLDRQLALAKDCDPNVRYQLAENHKLSLSVLNMLADDEHPYVACRAQRTIARLQTS